MKAKPKPKIEPPPAPAPQAPQWQPMSKERYAEIRARHLVRVGKEHLMTRPGGADLETAQSTETAGGRPAVMNTLFESPRWPGGPQICVAVNLPALPSRAALEKFLKQNGPSCSVKHIGKCEACGQWHAENQCAGPDRLKQRLRPKPKGARMRSDELASVVRRLHLALQDPQPGLLTWHIIVRDILIELTAVLEKGGYCTATKPKERS
jgi:hypothetical protein